MLFRSVSVVFVAEPADNPGVFIEGPNGFYKIRGLDNFSRESESIALAPVKISGIYWADTMFADPLPVQRPYKMKLPDEEPRYVEEALLRRYLRLVLS